MVDDDGFMREILATTLSEGYAVTPAGNGADALTLAQSITCDASPLAAGALLCWVLH